MANLHTEKLEKLEGFTRRAKWFIKNVPELSAAIDFIETSQGKGMFHLALPTKKQLSSVMKYLFDEEEFYSPFGIRSLSKFHQNNPFSMSFPTGSYSIAYCPGESDTPMFGGNSNWRGPIWMPMNLLLCESLERAFEFYGPGNRDLFPPIHLPFFVTGLFSNISNLLSRAEFKVEVPTRSGNWFNLLEASYKIQERCIQLFTRDPETGKRPYNSNDPLFESEHFKDHHLFYEYFHGDNGSGLGASHQTGWTALVANMLDTLGRKREGEKAFIIEK